MPQELIALSKQELKELVCELVAEQVENEPMNMTLGEVAEYYGFSKPWIVKKILDDDYFRRKIEPFSTLLNENGGGKYAFNRKRMKQFLNDYDEEIKKRAKRSF